MEIMTPEHPKWFEFCIRLHNMLVVPGCTGKTDKPKANALLKMMGLDVAASLAYFENHGGWCDCEILMNVNQPDLDQLEAEFMSKVEAELSAYEADQERAKGKWMAMKSGERL